MNSLSSGFFGLAMTLALAACGGGSAGTPGTGGGTTSTGDAETPPQGAANVQAWLATGVYKNWSCETAAHAARPPSPHGFDRVCSNAAIAGNAAGTAAWPVGAAAVKELFAALTDTTPGGYAVYLKTADDTTAGGAVWYWYEQPPGMSPLADGLGNSGNAMSICVSCHSLAGADAGTSPGSRDLVYTPVP
jgi:hypothetical protein